MLLSHKYKFIFIKTKKVGGTSVEIALSKYLGEMDVITPCSELTIFGGIRRFEKETEEDIRKNFNGVEPRNYKGNLIEEMKSLILIQIIPFLKSYILNLIKRFTGKKYKQFIKLKRRFKYEQHMTANEIKSILPIHVYNSYNKVTIIRNPYDQAISDYYDMKYRPEHEKIKNFDEYLLVRSKIFFKKNYEKFVINNEIQADIILRYESLKEDLLNFCKKKNLPENVIKDFEKINTHSGLNRNKLLLNDNQKNIIKLHARFFFENFYKEL